MIQDSSYTLYIIYETILYSVQNILYYVYGYKIILIEDFRSKLTPSTCIGTYYVVLLCFKDMDYLIIKI